MARISTDEPTQVVVKDLAEEQIEDDFASKDVVTAVSSDHVLIGDASDSDAVKRALISDFASAGGNMDAATYDPTTVGGDAFDMDNMAEGTNLILTASERSAISASTSHASADGSSHTFIDQDVTNASAPVLAVTNMTGSAAGLDSDATAHASADGSSHTFIDQSVVSGASPTFDNDNFTATTDKNYVTDAEAVVIGNTSNTNSGDEVAADLTTAGIVELATAAETLTGTDETRAATPVGVKAVADLKAPIDDPTFTTGISLGAASLSEAELEILDGATLTTAELNYVDGVTSPIQPQITANLSRIDILSAQVDDNHPTLTSDQLQFSIASNTTIGYVSPWTNTTMTHWAYNLDSTATPTGTGVDADVNGVGTVNVGEVDLGDYDSHSLYGWYKDADGADTWLQVKPDPLLDDDAAIPGLPVVAINTLAPTEITDFAVAEGSDTTSQIIITFTSATSVKTLQTDLYRTLDGTDGLFRSVVSTDDEFSNISAGVAYNLFLRVTDEDGLSSDSNNATITLSAGANGIVSIVDALVTKITDDDTATLNIALQITDRTQTAQTSTVTCSTVDDTAVAGTNFTGVSSATVTFPAQQSFNASTSVDTGTDVITITSHPLNTGDGVFYDINGGTVIAGLTDGGTYYIDDTGANTFTLHLTRATAIAGTGAIDITSGSSETHLLSVTSRVTPIAVTTALESIKNLTAQLHIDPGSEGSGGGAGFYPEIAAFPDNATLFKIDGTGTVDGTASDQVSGEIVFELEAFTGREDYSFPSDEIWENYIGLDTLGNDLSDGYVGAGQMTVRGGAVLDDDTIFTTTNPRLDKLVNFQSTGAHYIWVRNRASAGWRTEVYVGFNQSDNMAGGPLLKTASASTSIWRWTKHSGSYNVTSTGTQTFNIYKVDTWFNCDRIVITDDNAYDPSGIGAAGSPGASENEGPAITALAGGAAATDDPNNLLFATNPDPGTTPYDPSLFVPVNGSGQVGIRDSITVRWPEGTNIFNVDMVVTDSVSSLTIAGATTIIDPVTGYGEGLRWSPTQDMVEDVAHTTAIDGTCNDPAGVTKTIDYTGYSFTTFDSGAGSILYSSLFSQFPTNTDFTAAYLPAAFGWVWGPGSGFGADGKQYAFFRDDPEGVRGTVMMMQLPPGKAGLEGAKVETRIDWSINQDGNNAAGVEEIWIAYDVYLSDNYKCASGHKMPGLLAYGDSGPSSGVANLGRNCAVRGTYSGNLDDGSVPIPSWPYPFINKIPLPNGGLTCPAIFAYDAEGSNANQFANASDDTVNISSSTAADQYNMPRGQWVRNKIYLKSNTINVNGPPVDAGYNYDGIMSYYMDGIRMVHRTGVPFRSYDWVDWNLGYFTYFWGGGSTDWRSPDDQEQQLYIDRIVISTTDPDA